MILLGISDIHGDISKIEKVAEVGSTADLVILTGDVTHFGREEKARQILDPILEKNSQVLAVTGNCDFPAVDLVLKEKGINIHRAARVINGIGFIGIGGSLATPVSTLNETSEDEFGQYLKEAVSDLPPDLPIVLISHQPPYNTACDRIGSGVHVGSRSVRQFIEDRQPLVCFTGHIHEAVGMDEIKKTRVINSGPLWHSSYALAHVDTQADPPVQDLKIMGF